MTTNPRYVTRPIAAGKEIPIPSNHNHLPSFSQENKLRRELKLCAYDGDVITVVCQYLRETLKDYGDQGKVATKLVDIIEEVIK